MNVFYYYFTVCFSKFVIKYLNEENEVSNKLHNLLGFVILALLVSLQASTRLKPIEFPICFPQIPVIDK